MTDEEKQAAIAAAEAQIIEQSKRIEFYLTEYTVELLAQKMRDQEFEIPAYQREDTWEKSRKWRFIESLLMGLPIPFLFFWEKPTTGKLEIVDGSQRLRTIEQFVLGDLTLGKLEVLTELDGFGFKDLPESRQRKLKNRSIRGIVLNEHADDRARFDLFDRINTGSKIADPAEIRRGALPGPFLDLVIALAGDQRFKRIAPLTPNQMKTREGEELVTRFFAYSDGLDGYRDRVSAFLLAYARRMNERFSIDPAAIPAYRRSFDDTMAFIERVFPFGFRKSQKGVTTRKARFEAIAVGSRLALREDPALANEDLNVSDWVMSKEFSNITGADGANAIGRLQARIEFVRSRLRR
jgi:hypothetical protein